MTIMLDKIFNLISQYEQTLILSRH